RPITFYSYFFVNFVLDKLAYIIPNAAQGYKQISLSRKAAKNAKLVNLSVLFFASVAALREIF
ncbi:MAG: hypothetical protein ACE5HX_18665, partial [bacterium]